MNPKHTFEIEQKYRISDPRPFRLKLQKLKAKRIDRVWEENELWDIDGQLKKKQSVLRLRRAGKKTILTFKGPVLKGRHKKRLELEMKVDCEPMKTILKALGYKVFLKYAKTRETYRKGPAEIVIDHLEKLGWFIEIEAGSKQILRLAKALGLKKSYEEPLSYPALLRKSLSHL